MSCQIILLKQINVYLQKETTLVKKGKNRVSTNVINRYYGGVQ